MHMRVLPPKGVPLRHGVAEACLDPDHTGLDPVERLQRQRDRLARAGQAMHPGHCIEHEGMAVEVAGEVTGLACLVDREDPAFAAVCPVIASDHRGIGPLGQRRPVAPSEQGRLRETCDLAGLHHQTISRLRKRRAVEREPLVKATALRVEAPRRPQGKRLFGQPGSHPAARRCGERDLVHARRSAWATSPVVDCPSTSGTRTTSPPWAFTMSAPTTCCSL